MLCFKQITKYFYCFFFFHFISVFLIVSASNNPKYFQVSVFSECFDFFLIWQFCFFRHLSFSVSHNLGPFFNANPTSWQYILTGCINFSNSSSFLANCLMSSMYTGLLLLLLLNKTMLRQNGRPQQTLRSDSASTLQTDP